MYSATKQCYEKLEESVVIIKSKIASGDVVHTDETGLRVDGKLHWLHTASSMFFTNLFIEEHRGEKALKSNKSILETIIGWLVHDCLSSYFTFKELKHTTCGAHILRELEELVEGDQSKWAQTFKKFLVQFYLMPFEERIRRKQQIESRNNLSCGIGEKLDPPTCKIIRQKGQIQTNKRKKLSRTSNQGARCSTSICLQQRSAFHK